MNQLLKRSSQSRKTAVCLLAAMLIAFAAPARLPAQQDDKQKEKQKKEEQKRQEKAAKAEEKAVKKDAREERQYQEIKRWSLEKYNSDPAFKDGVNDKFRALRRSHAEQAYEINTRLSTAKLVSRDGEKLRFDDTLYDNPLAQDYVNRVGQSLVPATSKNLYAFKIVQNPIPEARSLSTGTVYISTGYLALVDNEAQLAYILGHEIGHVEKDHWFEDALVGVGAPAYQEAKQRKIAIFTGIASAVTGGVLGGGDGALLGAYIGVALAPSIAKIFSPTLVEWEKVQEDEADAESMRYMFSRNYDVREVPKFYERMAAVTNDPRTQTGFIAEPNRVKERMTSYAAVSLPFIKDGASAGSINLANNRGKALSLTGARGIARMLGETLAPDIQKKLESGELIASGEEFQAVMALVKRDNGIRAFQFDMFQLSRANLEDSIGIRSNDPAAFYFYGKVLKQTARNPSEVSKALQNLTQAAALDKRQTLAEPYLYRALLKLADRNPNETAAVIEDMKTYVAIYQRENGGATPPNMEFIYDFMQDLGAQNYRATPAMNVATVPSATVNAALAQPQQPRSVETQPKTQTTAPPGGSSASPAARKRGKQ